MDALLIGYARVSTEEQDLSAQRDALAALGVGVERTYVDQGLTGTNRERPGLPRPWPPVAPATPWSWPSSTAWLAPSPMPGPSSRSSPAERSSAAWAAQSTTPLTRWDGLLFNVLAMVAEFEGDLIRMRTREGMKVARAKGRLRGKQPKLNVRQDLHLVALHRAGEHSVAELGDLFGVTRSTVYRAIQRDAARQRTALPGRDPLGAPCCRGSSGHRRSEVIASGPHEPTESALVCRLTGSVRPSPEQ